jgi:hypothetical protein
MEFLEAGHWAEEVQHLGVAVEGDGEVGRHRKLTIAAPLAPSRRQHVP